VILFSLEDPYDIALCSGGQWAGDHWTSPGEQLSRTDQGKKQDRVMSSYG